VKMSPTRKSDLGNYRQLDTYFGAYQLKHGPNQIFLPTQEANQMQRQAEAERDEIKRLQAELADLHVEISQLKKAYCKGSLPKSRGTHYRKNERVYYIPRKPIFEKVLAQLRDHDDEPIKITMLKVFREAAKALGVRGDAE